MLVAVNSSTETVHDQQECSLANILTVRNSTLMLLFKVLPIEVTGPNISILQVFALIDEGSSASLKDADWAEKLGVTGASQKITLNWKGNHKKVIPTIKCQLKVRTIEGATNWPVQSLDIESLNEKYIKLRTFPIKGYGDAKLSILIGLENSHLTKTLRIFYMENSLIASIWVHATSARKSF